MGYFKPLRRKLGVLTLFMACVFAAGWIRSISCWNVIDLSMLHRSCEWNSSFGSIQWAGWDAEECVTWPVVSFGSGQLVPLDPDRAQVLEMLVAADCVIDNGGMNRIDWIIPYWSIVVPLTLLSGWLLLSKPRQQRPPVPSASEKVA